jgi:NitT/TauT family transport system substrate-binding protein
MCSELATAQLRRSRPMGLSGCLLLFILLSGCAASTPAQSPPASAPLATEGGTTARPMETVVVGGLGGNLDDGFWVGEAKGYYAEQGITLNVERFNSAAAMVPLLATGKVDAGHGSMSPALFNAIATDIPVKIVSDVTILRDPAKHPGARNSLWIIGRQDLSAELKTVGDLKGRTIAINTPGSSNNAQLTALLPRYGLTIDEVHVEILSFADALTALSNKAIDAAITVEPYVTQANEQRLAFPLFDLGTGFDGVPVQTLFYGPQFVEEKPEAARRFMVGYTRAMRFISDGWVKNIHREELVQLYVTNTSNQDVTLYGRMGLSFKETNGTINSAWMEQLQDFYVQQGLQNKKVDNRSLIDTSFSEHAVKTLGRYTLD